MLLSSRFANSHYFRRLSAFSGQLKNSCAPYYRVSAGEILPVSGAELYSGDGRIPGSATHVKVYLKVRRRDWVSRRNRNIGLNQLTIFE